MAAWAPLDGWAKEGETITLSVLREPRLAKGVRGYAFDTLNGIYITALRAEKPGSGHVSKFLDSLPKDQRVVFPVVVNSKLRDMLVRRGYVERWEIGEPYHDDVPVMERRADNEPPLETGARYYDRDGDKLSSEEWVSLYEDVDYRCIRSSNIGTTYRVSTLWLGIDHNVVQTGAPLIFATFLLARPTPLQAPHWSRAEAYTTRYPTERLAREGHDAMVRMVCATQRVDPSSVEEGTCDE
jgi:hypothetical protein